MQKQFLVAIFALFSITNFLFSQTPGMIVEPATGAAALVLDPNSNGYVSATTAGFLGNDQLIANNELPWQTLIPAGSEPNSDVQNGPNCGFTDFVESSVGGIDPVFHLTTGGNWLFRFRMASIAPNAKSYSILVDIDNLIGPGDDCYIPGVNPGFELEIVLATKFGVRIYDHRLPCGSNLIYTYGPERIQKSIAASTVCSQLNFFLETYVSWADITAQFGVTPSTPMRYAIVDNMAADKSTICNPSSASDIGGVDDNACGNLEACFTEIVNLQPPCPPNSISPCIYSACPVISGTPLAAGATSISGTSTEANGTVIRIYVNGVLAGSGTVTGGNWTVSGLTPLAAGAQVSATAQATNEVESGTNCNNAQVAGATCTNPVTNIIQCNASKAFTGTADPGAVIRLYNASGVLQTPTSGTVFAGSQITASTFPSGLTPATSNFLWRCVGSGATTSCTAGGGPCIADGNYYVTAQLPGQCESSPTWFCVGLTGSTNVPQITTNISTSTIVVSGTLTNNVAENNGVSIFLYVNSAQIATTTTNNLGAWSITVPAGTFDACDQVYVVAARNIATQRCPSQSTSIIVTGGITSTPTVSGPLCGTTNEVSGTVNEQNGTQIQVFSNGVSVGTTTVSGGTWVLTGLNIPAGAVVTAQATNTSGCESVSALSVGITVGTQTTNAVSITQNPLIENNLVISGTGTNGDVVTLYIDNWPLYTSFNETTPASATVSGGAWSITLTQSTLYAGGTITAFASNALTCLSLPQDQTPVVCLPPNATLVVNPDNSTICSGTAVTNVIIQNSQTGVIYQLYNSALSANSGSSLLGNGGNITLTSAPISSSTTLTVLAIKSPFNGSCNQFLTENIPVSVVAVPTISYVSQSNPNCGLSDGSITISGLGNNLTYSVNYSLNGTATSGSYTSNASGQLVINNLGGGTYTNISTTAFGCNSTNTLSGPYTLNLTTNPNVPLITTTSPTCSSNGTATITNYSGSLLYTFNPAGPSIGVGNTITNLSPSTNYTITATNASGCFSSSTFSITAQLTTPSTPTVSTAAATCSAAGTATITNYSGTLTYTFTPAGPSAGAGGSISGMTAGTSYTVTAGNGSCTSVASSSFSIAAQLTTPSTPTVSTAAATCSAAGTATITNYSGTLTYTFTPAGPSAGAGGSISGMTAGTSYTVTAGNGSCTSVASSSFSIAVPLCGPTANDNSTSTNEDTPVVLLSIQSNDTDADGNVVTSTIDLDPTTPGQQTTLTTANGTWTLNSTTGDVTFTPSANFNGAATITYTIQDNSGLTSNAANLTVTVNAVNDGPDAVNDSATTNEDTPVVIDVTNNDTDTDGAINDASVTIVSNPTNGTVTVNPTTGEVTYTPNPGYNGTDSFTYSVCDNGTPLPAQCDQATVSITVNAVNDVPNAVDDVASTNEDTPVVIDVTNNDTDTDGAINDASVSIVSNPTNGTVSVNPTTGEVTYTPNPGFNGTDSFTYSVCDNGTPLPAQCDQATVTVTVNAVNDPPVVDNDSNTITEDGGPATGDLTDTGDSDPDGTTLTVNTTPVDGPNNGTIIINADGTYSYTPNAGFNGNDTIVVSVCDNGTPLPAICVNDTLVITVTPVNDGPDAVNDVASTNEDTPVVIDVTNNDTDTDGAINDASVTIVSNPTNGTVSVNPTTGEVTYTPNPGFNGTDSFTYSVCDNGTPLPAQCDQATVTVTVNAVNDPPVVDNDSNTITEDGGPATGDLTDTGDSDPDGTTLTVNTTPVDGPNNGTIIINADGTYSYTPNAGFNGNDTIVVSVCDNGSPLPTICVNDTLVITVTPVNDAPNANSDFANTNENISVTINVVNNDTDSDGNIDETTLTVVDQPTNGSVTVNTTTGQITYTPNNGFTGTDTLVYQICDNGTPLPALCDTAVVIVTVLPCGTDLTVDCDGDGVTNGDEIDPDGDGTPGPNGTDPNDPCSLTVADQTVAPSQAWLDADCDVDGVTNGDEIDPDGDGTPGPNGTDPNNPCSLNIADQSIAPSQAWLDADCDGDGVTNGDEIDSDGDGNPGPNATDPIDPCSFDTQNQDLATVSQIWLDTDCDGDGVTNGNEIDPDGDGTPGPNGTNPSDSCSLNIADQSVAPSQAWLDADCDGDGVTNGDEIDPDGDGTPGPNGTDPNDPCSLNISDQSVAPSQAWLDADCDGDGVTNGDEIDPDGDGTPGPNGTDPNDPCSLSFADQTVAPSQAWLDADCDGDGVTNGDEIDPDGDGTPGPNGTDPNDPCSLNIADQSIAPSQAWLDADCDGDGVTNGDEIDSDGDGNPGPNATDPIDPCSLNIADQSVAPSQAWLDADCDGDGVTNGDEIDPDGDGTPGPNGTDPNDPCSLNIADQSVAPSQAWLDADCDGDGVTNGDEIDPDGDGTPGPNGTDPNDPCSLNIADQSVAPSQAWLDADCDGDGVTNGDEIDGGSNPFDPCDPNSTLPGCSSGVVVPQAFTPDGDGTNDLFVITGIENYPQNKLTFYNRWGNEVFYAEGYSNDWDGTANRGIILGDGLLPTATYYYILDLNGDGSEILKGYVYIKR